MKISHREYSRNLIISKADLDDYTDEGDFLEENLDTSQFSPCPLCGGDGIPLGKLGAMKHYRCRQCGYNFGNK
jgi:transposase-like protein